MRLTYWNGKQLVPTLVQTGAGWSSPVAREAHNLEVAGSDFRPSLEKRAGDFFYSTRLLLKSYTQSDQRLAGAAPAGEDGG